MLGEHQTQGKHIPTIPWIININPITNSLLLVLPVANSNQICQIFQAGEARMPQRHLVLCHALESIKPKGRSTFPPFHGLQTIAPAQKENHTTICAAGPRLELTASNYLLI